MQDWVSFPNILPNSGIRFNIDKVAFEIGSLSVRWYGVIICFGFVLAVVLAMRACKKYGISQDDLLDYLLFAMPAAVIGARLYYVAFRLDYYLENPKEIINYTNGGLAIYGGIIGAVIAAAIVAKVKKQSFLKIIDFSVPYIILGQAIGRWGNLINQEAYGGPTALPWGMTGSLIEKEVVQMGYEAGTLVHPTFLYESLWCIAGFVLMLVYRRKWQKARGEVLCFYMIYYGIGRAMIEGLRTDSLMLGSFRVSQLLSLALIIVGIAMFIDLRKRYRHEIYEKGTADGETESSLSGVVARMEAADETTEKGEIAEREIRRGDEMQSYAEQDTDQTAVDRDRGE